jgi:hypothetical protein
MAVGVATCFALYSVADSAELRGALGHAAPFLPLLLLAPVVGLTVHALAWGTLLPSDLRPSFWSLVRSQIVASAGNWLGAGVLGEPVKVAHARSGERTRLLTLLAVDNAVQLWAVFAFLGYGAVLLVGERGAVPIHGRTHELLVASSFLIAVASAIVAIGLLLAARGWGASHLVRALSDVSPLRLAGAAALHLLGKAWIVVELGLALALVGALPSAAATAAPSAAVLALSFGVTSVLASSVGAVVPGQLGLLEGALVELGSHVHVAFESVLALLVLRRFRSLVWVGMGALMAPGVIDECSHRFRSNSTHTLRAEGGAGGRSKSPLGPLQAAPRQHRADSSL